MSAGIAIGWWIGWGVGLVVVLLAAMLLALVIGLGRRVARQADDITAALDGGRGNTTPLFEVTHTNIALDHIARSLRVVRTGAPDQPRRARGEPTGEAAPFERLRGAWEEGGQ